MKGRYLILFFILISCLNGLAQNHYMDSLRKVLKTENDDTSKVNTLNTMSAAVEQLGSYDSSLLYAERANKLAEEIGFKKGIAFASIYIGNIYFDRGDYLKTLEYQQKALDISQQIGDKKGIAYSLTDIGIVYYNTGDYAKALDCMLKSLTIAQEIGNKSSISTNLCNLGAIYDNTGDHSKALEYIFKALEMDREKRNTDGAALDLANISGIYQEQENYQKALEYALQSLILAHEVGDEEAISLNLGNIGDLYEIQANYPKALEYFFKALAILRQIGNKRNTSRTLGDIGHVYTLQKNYKLARVYLDSSLIIAKNTGEKDNMKVVYLGLCSLDSATGNYKAAFDDHKEYIMYRDTLMNDDNKKKIMQTQLNYEFRNKIDSTKAVQDKVDLIAEKKNQQQKMLLYSFIGGFALMLILALFIFRGYRQKQRANKIIIQQKELVEEKNKEILDSINYAKRLQEAILPPINLIGKIFPDSFVFYTPKDIVAGDFYWMERSGENILIAAADCTGHGVPGALVSVICSNALNRAVKEFRITEPGKILDKVCELVIETFEKSENNVQDGMDISLCCINAQTRELKWSGAYNPLWYIHQGGMKELLADKQPIGMNYNPSPFNTHTLKLQKGDALYLFTDGYADQFGGPKGKKFKYKQLQEILLASASRPMEEQKIILEGHLDDWKGELEQVDDILIIGIKL